MRDAAHARLLGRRSVLSWTPVASAPSSFLLSPPGRSVSIGPATMWHASFADRPARVGGRRGGRSGGLSRPKSGDGVRPDTSFGNGRGFVTLEVSGQSTLASAGDRDRVMGSSSPDRRSLRAGMGRCSSRSTTRAASSIRASRRRGVFLSALLEVDGSFLVTAVAGDCCGRLLVAGGYGTGLGARAAADRRRAAGHDVRYGRSHDDSGGRDRGVDDDPTRRRDRWSGHRREMPTGGRWSWHG